jgi:hypothetical protein
MTKVTMRGFSPDPALVRAIGERVVRACLEVFGQDGVLGIYQHGSSVKGGMIPGFSDFDVHVLLKPGLVGPYGVSLDKVFAMQERVDGLGAREAGFSQFQGFFLDPAHLPPGWTGPTPGGYRVLSGSLPAGYEATDERLRLSSMRALSTARQEAERFHTSLVDAHDDTLRGRLRLMSTMITPMLYAAISYDQEKACALWAEDRFSAVRRLAERYADDPGHEHVIRFYRMLLEIGPGAASPEVLRSALKEGLSFIVWVDKLYKAISSQLSARVSS